MEFPVTVFAVMGGAIMGLIVASSRLRKDLDLLTMHVYRMNQELASRGMLPKLPKVDKPFMLG